MDEALIFLLFILVVFGISFLIGFLYGMWKDHRD